MRGCCTCCGSYLPKYWTDLSSKFVEFTDQKTICKKVTATDGSAATSERKTYLLRSVLNEATKCTISEQHKCSKLMHKKFSFCIHSQTQFFELCFGGSQMFGGMDMIRVTKLCILVYQENIIRYS